MCISLHGKTSGHNISADAGVTVDVDVLDGRPHGYGYTEGWIPAYDEWLTHVFESN